MLVTQPCWCEVVPYETEGQRLPERGRGEAQPILCVKQGAYPSRVIRWGMGTRSITLEPWRLTSPWVIRETWPSKIVQVMQAPGSSRKRKNWKIDWCTDRRRVVVRKDLRKDGSFWEFCLQSDLRLQAFYNGNYGEGFWLRSNVTWSSEYEMGCVKFCEVFAKPLSGVIRVILLCEPCTELERLSDFVQICLVAMTSKKVFRFSRCCRSISR